ncbi:NYN domain-containing protein [Kribbella sp. DT2]|uniref:NYN domain-containing protein n=1 Tax=Kribbella sp. DT2 TaxID=3393427 RepID=UPI003CEB3495
MNNEAVLLVDWLNLSIHLKNLRLNFGADLVHQLIAVARQECARLPGQVDLARAHFVGENISGNVRTAVQKTLVAELHETRTAKEQADLQLAVLAMDHLHAPTGCPALFFLATGDQDFVPLIERIVAEKSRVVLVVASSGNLAPAYRTVASQPNVSLISLVETLQLQPLPTTSAERTSSAVLALFRLNLDGRVLGGDQTKNIQLLTTWGQLSTTGREEIDYQGFLTEFTRTDPRKVAFPARSETGNKFTVMRRTSLSFQIEAVASTIDSADWVLRRLANPTRPAGIGDLSGGPFRSDDNASKLTRLLLAMKELGWILQRPDNTYQADVQRPSDGLLEPILRLITEASRLSFEAVADGVPRDTLFKALRSTPIAQDADRRGGKAAGDVIELGRRLGVIDAIPHGTDGYLLTVIHSHPLCRRVSTMVRNVAGLFDFEFGRPIAEHDFLARMATRDEQANSPVFGYDTRDRQRALRILRRSSLLDRRTSPEPSLTLRRSAWVESLLPPSTAR